MSDILIKGIEMPSDCMDCVLLNRNEEESDGSAADWYCPVTQSWTDYPTACKGRATDCPLKELIRCKDCRFFSDDWRCLTWHQFTVEHGWCFRAERRPKNE